MKKLFACVVFALFFFLNVFAQSSDVITEILQSKTVTFGQACYFTAAQQNLVNDDCDYTQAIQILYKKGQIPGLVHTDTPIPLVDIAYLFAQAWNVKGGLMYKLFKGAPRYAFKQLKSDGVIPQNMFPRSTVTGLQILDMFTTASLVYGNMQLQIDDTESQSNDESTGENSSEISKK